MIRHSDVAYWITGQVTGQDVLAIASRESSTTLRLARGGHNVTALLNDVEAIAHVRHELDLEPKRIQSRVTLEENQASSLPFPNQSFDSVVLVAPNDHASWTASLQEAARVTRPSGVVIVAAPYGAPTAPPRRPSPTVGDLLETLEQTPFLVVRAEMVADRVCLVGRAAPEAQRSDGPRLVLDMIERHLAQSAELIDELAASAAESRAVLDGARRELSMDAERASSALSQVARLESALATVANERDVAQKAAGVAAASAADLQGAAQRAAALEADVAGARQRSQRLEANLRETSEAADGHANELTKVLARIADLEAELVASEAALTQSELRSERLANSLAAIRASRSYSLIRLLWRIPRPRLKRARRS